MIIFKKARKKLTYEEVSFENRTGLFFYMALSK